MEAKNSPLWRIGLGKWLLRLLNLRPEESERTFLMFVFYTTTSMGLLWLDLSVAALFLEEYGADGLPLIYLTSAGMGVFVSFIYSWLQRILPLRRVIVVVAFLVATPLLLFRFGLTLEPAVLVGATVFLMRLWVDAVEMLNDLNTSITANQLFNIREIKRTYPIVSSGILVADVLSGFSMVVLVAWLGLKNVIVAACLALALGGFILLYLSQTYQQAFPDSPKRQLEEETQPSFTTRRLRGPMQRYAVLLFSFFILYQTLYLFIDFLFYSQLEQQFSGDQLASFLGIFSGLLGLCEVIMQWFASSRAIERIGVFATAMVLPVVMLVLGLFSFFQFFLGLIGLRFADELLHYTLIAASGPVLFQPIPDKIRSQIQSLVRGASDPAASGIAGISLLVIIWWVVPNLGNVGINNFQGYLLICGIILLSLLLLFSIWLLRTRYVNMLVLSAERGQLSESDGDLRALKRAVVAALERPGTEAYKLSCIDLLSQIAPQEFNEAIAPLLPNLAPALQQQSLEVMLDDPSPRYLEQVRSLLNQSLPPEVLAVVLRYVWLTEPDPDIRQLRPYLRQEVDPVVRGTAAALILRRGNPKQKAEATDALRRMLTHKRERERVMGCRALGETVYMQALRIYIPTLLQDESLRVRCALLEAIAATRIEEYYASLLQGLRYKSTRSAAVRALVRLENDALPMLLNLAEDIHKPDLVRMQAWSAIGQIGTLEALDSLVHRLPTSCSITRRNILRILLKVPHDSGIDAVLDRLGRSGVEELIDQEIRLIGQVYAALLDLKEERVRGREADLLRRALRDTQTDAHDRLFLLMKFLYSVDAVQAAAFNLLSTSHSDMARGLEILDNTLDIPSKRVLLVILDWRSDLEKMQSLSSMVSYQPLSPSDRLRHLLELRHFLADWPLACCFHLARQKHWRVTAEQILACLRHPRGFVRESVLSYLQLASPRALGELLPTLTQDPDPLVAKQVKHLLSAVGSNPGSR